MYALAPTHHVESFPRAEQPSKEHQEAEEPKESSERVSEVKRIADKAEEQTPDGAKDKATDTAPDMRNNKHSNTSDSEDKFRREQRTHRIN